MLIALFHLILFPCVLPSKLSSGSLTSLNEDNSAPIKDACGSAYLIDLTTPSLSFFVSGRTPANSKCINALAQAQGASEIVKHLYLRPSDGQGFMIEEILYVSLKSFPQLKAVTIDILGSYTYNQLNFILKSSRVEKLTLRILDKRALLVLSQILYKMPIKILEIQAQSLYVRKDSEDSTTFQTHIESLVHNVASLEEFILHSPENFILRRLNHQNIRKVTVRDNPSSISFGSGDYFDAIDLASIEYIQAPGRYRNLPNNIHDLFISETARLENRSQTIDHLLVANNTIEKIELICDTNSIHDERQSPKTVLLATYNLSHALDDKNQRLLVTLSYSFTKPVLEVKKSLEKFINSSNVNQINIVWNFNDHSGPFETMIVDDLFQELSEIFKFVSRSGKIRDYGLKIRSPLKFHSSDADVLAVALDALSESGKVTVNGYPIGAVIDQLISLDANEDSWFFSPVVEDTCFDEVDPIC